MSMVWDTYGAIWEYADPVHFDGPNRLIVVQPQVSTINMIDIYSAWIRWAKTYDNLKFLPAMRYIGNDPIGGGQYSGLMFFLQNNWQIVVDHAVEVDGIVYHDDAGISPFVIQAGGGVTNKVASLAYAYSSEVVGVPTAAENAASVRTELSTELSRIDVAVSTRATAAQVWEHVTRTLTEGGISAEIITKIQELALLEGLVSGSPLIVDDTNGTRSAGSVSQSIVTNGGTTTVTRV